jgi:hypothetical protein
MTKAREDQVPAWVAGEKPGLAERYVLAIAYTAIMRVSPAFRMYSDAWDIGEMLSGEKCWRGGFLFDEQAKPIAAGAMGDRGGIDPVELVEKAVNSAKHGDAFVTEAEAMIAEVVAAHAEERKRFEAWITKFDAADPDAKQLRDDDTPMFTAIKWVRVAEARDKKAA